MRHSVPNGTWPCCVLVCPLSRVCITGCPHILSYPFFSFYLSGSDSQEDSSPSSSSSLVHHSSSSASSAAASRVKKKYKRKVNGQGRIRKPDDGRLLVNKLKKRALMNGAFSNSANGGGGGGGEVISNGGGDVGGHVVHDGVKYEGDKENEVCFIVLLYLL